MDADIIGGFPVALGTCLGCGKRLLIENAWMTDGCPCNSGLGVNSMNETRWRLLMELQQRQSRELELRRRPLPAPEVGELRHCLVCATDKPWGVWDGKTGAAVCKQCRDKTRSGFCRDCADEPGTCPRDGLPCDPGGDLIRWGL